MLPLARERLWLPPGYKPEVNSRVLNPFAIPRDCKHAFLLNGSGADLFDRKTPQGILRSTAKWGASPAGVSLVTDGTDAADLNFTEGGINIGSGGNFGCFFILTLNSVSGNGTFWSTTGTGIDAYFSSLSSGVLAFTLANVAVVSSSLSLNVGKRTAIGISYTRGSSVRFWTWQMDGRSNITTNTVSSASSPTTVTGNPATIGSKWGSAGTTMNGMIECLYMWNRTLSDNEFWSLSLDPYGLATRRSRRIFYSVPAGSAASISDSDNLTLADSSSLATTQTSPDNLSIVDNSSLFASQTSPESIFFSENSNLASTQTSPDTITFTDNSGVAVSVGSSDSINIAENSALTINVNASDNLSLSENSNLQVVFSDNQVLSFSENSTLSTAQTSTDNLSIVDNSAILVAVGANDNLQLTESSAVTINLTSADLITLMESGSIAAIFGAGDSISFQENSSVVKVGGYTGPIIRVLRSLRSRSNFGSHIIDAIKSRRYKN